MSAMSDDNRNSRPLVMVSACLLGRTVRYDGLHKRDARIVETLASRVNVLPVCPEVDAGLLVPRPPVQLVQGADGVRALGVEDAGLDVTTALLDYARSVHEGMSVVCGLVSKSRSPSCGQGTAALHDARGQVLGFVDGLFVETFRRRFPQVPMIDEEAFADERKRVHFLDEVFALHASRTQGNRHE